METDDRLKKTTFEVLQLCLVDRRRVRGWVRVVVEIVAELDELIQFHKLGVSDDRNSRLPRGARTISKVAEHFTIPELIRTSDAQIVLQVRANALSNFQWITRAAGVEFHQKSVSLVVPA